jgi:hypothetical protein
MAFGYAGFLIMPTLHILALCWLARLFGRQAGRLWYGLALLSLTVSAAHVEVEPATLILDYRQALASFLTLWVLAFVLRVLAHTVRVATLPPVRAPGTVGATR